MMLIAAIALSAFMTACGGNNRDDMMENMSEEDGMGDMMNEGDGNAMQSAMSPIMTSYLEIKDALVSDNQEKASNAAKSMMEMSEMEDMQSSLKGIADSQDLKEQRKFFSELSGQMYNMAQSGDMSETMYWNHCPMAMGGDGANWLSMSEKISNPYMGQKMPGCGSVQETLNQ
ncbi:DUF3347 domain-containing protein [Cyclobacterium marinum]|uniref:DUF3347 domain-containing protein n=1 Tax=Cyclobacterium marinum TaxID=104 RepID=UPI00165901D5|nr:DUF3347 domain-containing protein [Cyclobacterium marinum]MBI0398055.1 DUF3347 domain-containing protein [Cyclobacterium marinum]